MSRTCCIVFGLVSLLSAVGAPAARAGGPNIPSEAFEDACEAAREADACPQCSCAMITSTSAIPAAKASSVPLGVVLELKYTDPATDLTYRAIHAAIGTREALEHVGRLAEARRDEARARERFGSRYKIVAAKQVFQGCPEDDFCTSEPMGLIHTFIVKTTEDGFLRSLEPGTFHREVTLLAMCFEGPGENTCTAMRIAESVETEPLPTDAKIKVKPSKTAYARTWKLDKLGEIAFGAAKGELAKDLAEPEAFTTRVRDLSDHLDAVELVRSPTE